MSRLPFAKERVFSQDRHDGLSAIFGRDGKLHLPLLKVKHRVGGVSLREDCVSRPVLRGIWSSIQVDEKGVRIERGPPDFLGHRSRPAFPKDVRDLIPQIRGGGSPPTRLPARHCSCARSILWDGQATNAH